MRKGLGEDRERRPGRIESKDIRADFTRYFLLQHKQLEHQRRKQEMRRMTQLSSFTPLYSLLSMKMSDAYCYHIICLLPLTTNLSAVLRTGEVRHSPLEGSEVTAPSLWPATERIKLLKSKR